MSVSSCRALFRFSLTLSLPLSLHLSLSPLSLYLSIYVHMHVRKNMSYDCTDDAITSLPCVRMICTSCEMAFCRRTQAAFSRFDCSELRTSSREGRIQKGDDTLILVYAVHSLVPCTTIQLEQVLLGTEKYAPTDHRNSRVYISLCLCAHSRSDMYVSSNEIRNKVPVRFA